MRLEPGLFTFKKSWEITIFLIIIINYFFFFFFFYLISQIAAQHNKLTLRPFLFLGKEVKRKEELRPDLEAPATATQMKSQFSKNEGTFYISGTPTRLHIRLIHSGEFILLVKFIISLVALYLKAHQTLLWKKTRRNIFRTREYWIRKWRGASLRAHPVLPTRTQAPPREGQHLLSATAIAVCGGEPISAFISLFDFLRPLWIKSPFTNQLL